MVLEAQVSKNLGHDALLKKYCELVADSKAKCTNTETGEEKDMFVFSKEKMKLLEEIIFWYKNEYDSVNNAFDAFMEATFKSEPKRILKSGDRTIVFWNDNTKTIVKRCPEDEDSDYAAFAAAYIKKVFGCNSKIRGMITRLTDYQEVRKK